MAHVIAPERQARRAFDGLDPHARFVGKDFAVSILAHAATRPIAKILRAAHRADKSSRMQNTLTAHAAVEDEFLAEFFDWQNYSFKHDGSKS